MNNIWHCPALPVFETPAVYFHPFPSTCPSLLTCGSYKHARKAWYGLAKLKHASDHNNYQIYTLRKTEKQLIHILIRKALLLCVLYKHELGKNE